MVYLMNFIAYNLEQQEKDSAEQIKAEINKQEEEDDDEKGYIRVAVKSSHGMFIV
jgi:hypothetical protein